MPTPPRNKTCKNEDLAVITTLVTGHLQKRIMENYQMWIMYDKAAE